MKRGFLTAVLAVFIATVVFPTTGLCREYVVMLSRNINIRTRPSTESVILGRAWKGDIFELVGEIDNWHEIVMFSGEYRYVSKSWAAKLTESDIVPGHRIDLPQSEDARRSIRRDIGFARARAKGEADEIIPASVDDERNANLRAILEDRFIQEAFMIHSIQPVLYGELIEGVAECKR